MRSSRVGVVGWVVAALFAAWLPACGGIVVFDEDGGGGGPPGTTAASGSIVASSGVVTTGTGGCTSHAECGDDLCLFTTGECARACGGDACDACGPGSFCDPCATSSCPGCRDCTAACVPVDGRCDDDDPCPSGSICRFLEGRCDAGCNAQGACDDLDEVCAPCESSSCCSCKDCVAGCIAPRD